MIPVRYRVSSSRDGVLMVVRALLLLFVATLMAACAPPRPVTPLLDFQHTMPKRETEIRATMAKMLARSRRFRITHDPTVRLMSATISGPRTTKPLFPTESFLTYCVETVFTREGWPIPILLDAKAWVYREGPSELTITIKASGCSGTAPEPFKEFEDLYRSLKQSPS
jgi:hypothetical protein